MSYNPNITPLTITVGPAASYHEPIQWDPDPWDPDLEEGNSRDLRIKMVKDIKNQASKILPRVLTALEIVPKHKFMDVDKTPGSSHSEKIKMIYTSYNYHHGVGNTTVEPTKKIGLKLSMLKIDVGMDVLIHGGNGYNESLVSQLVGPQGKVTVVDYSKPRIDELRTLMRRILPHQNITYQMYYEMK